MGARVFWLERTDEVRRYLRRFRFGQSGGTAHAGPFAYHDAEAFIDVVTAPVIARPEVGSGLYEPDIGTAEDFAGDPRWPTQCASCGEPFTALDEWQLFRRRLYRRADTGALLTLEEAPIGAMWDAWWMPDRWRGPDGICLKVQTPGGEWIVDSEASNCTDPAKHHDGRRTHFCWVRHGDPRQGDVHVDKNGTTCSAGAGSILAGGWHGFLHHNELVPT